MDYNILYGILIAIQSINIVLHTGGLYLLTCFSRMGREDIQLFLVGNLSASEVLLNITFVVIFSCNIYAARPESPVHALRMYTSMFSGSMIKFVYYMTMVYLALNKLLEVVLNVSYQRYCTMLKTKIIMILTWLLGAIFFLGISIQPSKQDNTTPTTLFNGTRKTLNDTLENQLMKLPQYVDIFTYFYTGFDFFFILIAVCTHGYIFHKYRESRLDPILSRSASNQSYKKPDSVWKVFRNSRFYVSCLLIATFIFMVVLPKLLYFFAFQHITSLPLKTAFDVAVGLLYYLSFLGDVVIYIFLHPPLKRLMWRKLGKISLLSHMIPNQQRQRDESFRMTTLSRQDVL